MPIPCPVDAARGAVPYAVPRHRAAPVVVHETSVAIPLRVTLIQQVVSTSPVWLLLGFLLFAAAWPAFAGTTGDELRPAAEKLSNLISGWGGKTICMCSLVLGIIGSALKFNPYAVAGCFGTCIVTGIGVGVVNASVTALI